jgi:hypothetical protein
MMKKDRGENRPAVTGSGTGAPGDGRLRRDDRFERIMAAPRDALDRAGIEVHVAGESV